MKKFPLEMQISEDTVIEFAIPSWHINAHGADCHANFRLSFRDGVGRTCGEEVEVAWAGTNPLGLVLESPVRSGFLAPRDLNRNLNRLTKVPGPLKTGPNRKFRLINRF
jgi:hypothetical protein